MPELMEALLAAEATLTADLHVGNVASRFAAAIVAGLEDLLEGYAPERMASDFDVRNLQVPAGAAHFQVQAFTLPQSLVPDANVNYFPAVTARVFVHYHLTPDESEQAWTQYGMQVALLTLIEPQWWRDLDEAFHVDEEPVGSGVQRIGNVVSFLVTVTVTIRPAGE